MNYDEHASRVTALLVAKINSGDAGNWSMPWHTHGFGDHLRARNPTTGSRYRGANTVSLALDGIDRGFPTGEWATYRQWTSVDAQVRRGERSSQIVKWITKTLVDDTVANPGDVDADGAPTRLIPRVYAVFNAHQVDGHEAAEAPAPDESVVGGWIASIGADVVYGGDRAYYMATADRIYMPGVDQFDDQVGFYATLIHELVHFTGHRSRLDRDIFHPFGSAEYAAEELIAELGAAIGCAQLGAAVEPRADHAAYLAHWLKILGEDPRALFRSAAAAQRAVDHLDDLATSSDQASPGSEDQPRCGRESVAA